MTHPRVTVFGPHPILDITIERRGTAEDDIHMHPGGQGVWVARMAGEMGAHPVLCGFCGGGGGGPLWAPLGGGAGGEGPGGNPGPGGARGGGPPNGGGGGSAPRGGGSSPPPAGRGPFSG